MKLIWTPSPIRCLCGHDCGLFVCVFEAFLISQCSVTTGRGPGGGSLVTCRLCVREYRCFSLFECISSSRHALCFGVSAFNHRSSGELIRFAYILVYSSVRSVVIKRTVRFED